MTDIDFATTVSAASGDLEQVAGFLLTQWLSNQAYGSTTMIVADTDTLRLDGPLTTIEADLFSVGDEPQSIRIIATGIHDADGMRIISADVHAPTKLTAVQAAAHGNGANPTAG